MESIQKLKRNLVAEMRGAPGHFREAVEEVRARWRIDEPPARLPSEAKDILLPPGLGKPGDLSELHAMWANHPLLPPLAGGVSGDPSSCIVWPSEVSTTRRNLKRRWEADLREALRSGGVSEEYLKDRVAISEDELPLYRFASACVLHEPPDASMMAFSNYGGTPPIKGWLTERQLKEQQMMAVIGDALDEMVSKEMWERRWELPDDYSQAKYEILERSSLEMQAEEDRIREDYRFEMEHNPPRRYYIEYDPAEDSNDDVLKKAGAIRVESGCAPRGGKPPMDRLTAMQCAVLYCYHNPRDPNDKRVKTWTYPKLAAEFKEYGVHNARSAEEHVKFGKGLLQTRKKIRKNRNT